MTLSSYLHRAKIAPRLIEIASWCESAKLRPVTERQAVKLLSGEWSRRAIREAIWKLRNYGVDVVG